MLIKSNVQRVYIYSEYYIILFYSHIVFPHSSLRTIKVILNFILLFYSLKKNKLNLKILNSSNYKTNRIISKKKKH